MIWFRVVVYNNIPTKDDGPTLRVKEADFVTQSKTGEELRLACEIAYRNYTGFHITEVK